MRCAIPVSLLIVLACLVAAAALPARANAASGVKYGLTDDAWLLDGPGTLESRVERLDALGVRIVRFTLHWDAIARSQPAAPTDAADPAYDWTTDDQVLDGLRAHRIDVVLQLVGTPGWANGGLPANYARTSATTFYDFASAAASKYSWEKR